MKPVPAQNRRYTLTAVMKIADYELHRPKTKRMHGVADLFAVEHESLDTAMPRCRAPIPSKGKQQIGASSPENGQSKYGTVNSRNI